MEQTRSPSSLGSSVSGPGDMTRAKTQPSKEPDYLEGMSEHLLASADLLFVVEGTDLPCHKQVMAVQSRVFAGMADLIVNHKHGAHLATTTTLDS